MERHRHLIALVTAALAMVAPTTIVASESAAISLLSPSHEAALASPDPAAAVVALSWRAAPGVAEYRVVVATDASLKKAVIQRTTADASVSVRGLRAGTYFWRVEPLGGNDAKVQPSRIETFSTTAKLP